jgi:protein-S-isoprenylcysteine O-methyltransferase Ste14
MAKKRQEKLMPNKVSVKNEGVMTFTVRYWSPQLRIQSDHKIMKRGPYKVIRHPIYSSMFVWCFGSALFAAHWFFIGFFLLTVVLLSLRAPKEEKMMLREFGDEYALYQKETGRFFPRIGAARG